MAPPRKSILSAQMCGIGTFHDAHVNANIISQTYAGIYIRTEALRWKLSPHVWCRINVDHFFVRRQYEKKAQGQLTCQDLISVV